jgi:hypothetical protein
MNELFARILTNEDVSFTKAYRIDRNACFDSGSVVQAAIINEFFYGNAYGI